MRNSRRQRTRKPAEVLTSIIGPNVKLMQSMLFIKSESKPGQAWHQDEAHGYPYREEGRDPG